MLENTAKSPMLEGLEVFMYRLPFPTDARRAPDWTEWMGSMIASNPGEDEEEKTSPRSSPLDEVLLSPIQ